MLLSKSTLQAALLSALTLIAFPALGKYDDVIFLKNGDRLSGDIKELSRDMLRYKTDSMGTLYVRWEDIQSVQTEKYLRIELKSGRRLVGTLGRADAPEQLIIATRGQDEIHYFDELVAFVPLKLRRDWIDRIEGSMKFGLNGTKGSNTLQWNLGANALYRGENWEFSTRWDSIVTDRSDDTSTQNPPKTRAKARPPASRNTSGLWEPVWKAADSAVAKARAPTKRRVALNGWAQRRTGIPQASAWIVRSDLVAQCAAHSRAKDPSTNASRI